MKDHTNTHIPWNKYQIMGQKRPFNVDELSVIEQHLQSLNNWHDLALLGCGLDTMLRASDLLAMKVWRVQYPNGYIKRIIPLRQRKTKTIVKPVLTEETQAYLKLWITTSGKSSEDYLFTRTKSADALPIRRIQLAEIIKSWAEMLGHNRADFSTHSLRRTKATLMYWAGEDIALISRLLGHKSLASTIDYIGITQTKAEQAALRHSLLSGPSSSQVEEVKKLR